jgi:lysophospholipase
MNDPRLLYRTHPDDLAIRMTTMADGWALRTFERPAPAGQAPRGSLLFLTGLGEFFEKYLEAIDDWHHRGWAVAGFDWRGQGGSGRLLANPRIAHIDNFDRQVDDLMAMITPWLASTPGPHVIVAHSMGGHILTRTLAEHRPAIDAVAMSAPMMGLPHWPIPAKVAGCAVAALCRIGLTEKQAWRGKERPTLPGTSRDRLLTHDMRRYADESAWIDSHPALVLGPPSWGWIAAALQSVVHLHQPGLLERINVPVLICAAGADRLVCNHAIVRAQTRIPDARIQMFPDAYHELLREADQWRAPVMSAIDAFLDAVAPAAR